MVRLIQKHWKFYKSKMFNCVSLLIPPFFTMNILIHLALRYSAPLTMLKPSTVWNTTNCGKFLEMGILDHLTSLFISLYASQEATVRTGHGTIDWFQIGKGVWQGCILSPCLFNFYAEYILRNAGLDEAQAGIRFARRNINNLRYGDDTTLMAQSEKKN